LPSATSFICKTLSEIIDETNRASGINNYK
jgi:hypothetical protein